MFSGSFDGATTTGSCPGPNVEVNKFMVYHGLSMYLYPSLPVYTQVTPGKRSDLPQCPSWSECRLAAPVDPRTSAATIPLPSHVCFLQSCILFLEVEMAVVSEVGLSVEMLCVFCRNIVSLFAIRSVLKVQIVKCQTRHFGLQVRSTTKAQVDLNTHINIRGCIVLFVESMLKVPSGLNAIVLLDSCVTIAVQQCFNADSIEKRSRAFGCAAKRPSWLQAPGSHGK